MSGDRIAMSRMSTWVVHVLAIFTILLMLSVAAQVLLSLLDINPVLQFERDLPVVGTAVTLNSLLDLQWHFFAVICLLPAGLVLLANRHVRVDFLYDRMPARRRGWIDLTGHAVFAAPFLIMALPASWDFAMRALRSQEASRNAGLNDLWLIKMVLPVGLGLLALAVLVDAVRIIRSLRRA